MEVFKKLITYAAYAAITVIAINCVHINVNLGGEHSVIESVNSSTTLRGRVEVAHNTLYPIEVRAR